jgi:1-deoxy-D-xylulose-5-phosphate reductoisomerase
MKRIVILGSTGSIGTQTLDVVRAFPEEFEVIGLSAWNNQELLRNQVWEFNPKMVFCRSNDLGSSLPSNAYYVEQLDEMVVHNEVDLVVQGLVGGAGLIPTIAALRAGKQVALANKEPIVMAGELIMQASEEYGGQLLPVDSEPSAVWQCLRGEDAGTTIRRLIITASGGPFRQRPIQELESVTLDEALRHPTWSMGNKITVDSATLMNKGFEVIESHWLFRVPWDKLDVVIHPQSIVHAMVEFNDGSVKAQLGWPDMRLPIQYAMFYPRRPETSGFEPFNPAKFGTLTFEPMDLERYPCFSLALAAGEKGGTYPAVLSAADEIAVGLFLQKRVGFTDIQRIVGSVIDRHQASSHPTVEQVLEADSWARRIAHTEALGAM